MNELTLHTLKVELQARDDLLYKIKKFMGDDNFRAMMEVIKDA